MLTFDDPTHTYRWNGVVVPGVTSLLKPIYDFSSVPVDILEQAAERGTYAHAMCELYDLDRLDEQANAQVEQGRYIGYLAAWKSFLEDYAPNWEAIEESGFSKRHRFAGTLDRRGTLGRHPRSKWILDLKTAKQSHPAWGPQLAAYRAIVAEREIQYAVARRATVQIWADGSYAFEEFTEPDDWDAFSALLALHNWGVKHG